MMENRFERFAAAVLEMNRYLQRIKEQEMRRFGLRSAHTMCIFYLGQHPEGLTVTQLTEICREDKAAVSRNLSELSRMGLVSCSAPPDRRVYRDPYRLTERGTEIAAQVEARVSDALSACGRGLTEAQRDNFYTAAQIIISNLEDYAE